MPSLCSYTTRSTFLIFSGILDVLLAAVTLTGSLTDSLNVSYLIAARMPEKPAPMTITFLGLRFSTGSLLRLKFSFVDAITRT